MEKVYRLFLPSQGTDPTLKGPVQRMYVCVCVRWTYRDLQFVSSPIKKTIKKETLTCLSTLHMLTHKNPCKH